MKLKDASSLVFRCARPSGVPRGPATSTGSLAAAWKIPWTGEPGRLQSMGPLLIATGEAIPLRGLDDVLQNGLVGSPCSPRDSQESSPIPQFKTSILRCSAFFTVQLSHPYMTTGKTIALTRRTFVGKVITLLFNILSSLVITFLPRSKRLLISCLQSPSAVILEPRKIKSDTVSTVSPSISHEVVGPDAMIFVF